METPTLTSPPFTRPQDYYQLRDFGQKFEATINFMKQHGGNLYRVLLVSLIPLLAGSVIMALGALPIMQMADPRANRSATAAELLSGTATLSMGAGWLLIIAGSLLLIALLYGFMKCRMEKAEAQEPVSLGEAWASAQPYLLPLVLHGIVVFVLMMLGYVLLALPGIYLSIAYALFPCVLIFENAGLGQSISRPLSLIRGKWWSTFGLVFVGFFAVGLVAGVLGSIASLAVGGADGPLMLDARGMTAGMLVRLVINYAASPVIYVLLAFQYFNLVDRRDGISLQWKIDQLGQQPAAGQVGRAEDDALFRPSYGEQNY